MLKDSGTVGFSYEEDLNIKYNRMLTILNNVKNLFISPRFVSFYWQAGSVALVGLLSLISENLASIGLPDWAVVFTGLVIAQITKAINNRKLGKEMGFSNK